MRKAILALVVVGMFIGASGVALAGSQMWSMLDAQGTTMYNSRTIHGGIDWQRTGDVESGNWYIEQDKGGKEYHFWLDETVHNTGNLNLARYVNAPGEWDLQETKDIVADGETLICKDLLWKTNCRSVFDGTTELAHPTIMNIDILYEDDTPTYDHEAYSINTNDGSNVGDDPSYSNWGYFTRTTQSDNNMHYHQAIGDNLDPLCVIPEPPICDGYFWCGQ